MSKILFTFLLIMSFNFYAIANTEVNTTKIADIIKPRCIPIHKDYLYFMEKSTEYEGEMKKRWENIANAYKEEFLRCNSAKIDISKKSVQFFEPNPLNSIKK